MEDVAPITATASFIPSKSGDGYSFGGGALVTINGRSIFIGEDREAFKLSEKIAAAINNEARLTELEAALNERCLFINPHLLEQAAGEIDCCPGCESVSTDYSVNCSECSKSDNGEYCPNDVAETLRALAKVARTALKGEKR